MSDRNGFFAAVSDSLRKGILTEIYTSEDLAVLRVADSFYIATDYTPAKDGYISYLVNSKMVRAMMLDHSYLAQLPNSLDEKTLSQMVFILNDKTFRKFRKEKGSPVSDLTHRFVDPQMEQWIFTTYGVPVSPEKDKPNKRRFLR